MCYSYKNDFLNFLLLTDSKYSLGIGDWGLGIGDWAPIPNPHKYNFTIIISIIQIKMIYIQPSFKK